MTGLSDTAKMVLHYRTSDICKKYPASVPYVGSDGRIYGNWMIGQDYRSRRGYYGEYPRSYLIRVMALFPPNLDPQRTLHLFSGSINRDNCKSPTFDMDPANELRPSQRGDAHRLSEYFQPDAFDIILADPPYSEEDARHYGTPLINRNKVIKEAEKVLVVGGWIVWLDQVFPMFCSKNGKSSERYANLTFMGWISVVRSTNHRVRCAFFFQKRDV